MRILALIVATLLLVGTLGLGLLGANRGIKDAKDIDGIYGAAKTEIAAAAKAGDKTAIEMKSLGESTGRLRIGGALMAVTGVLALVLLVLTYLSKPVVKVFAGGVIASAALAVVISPQYDLGPLAPASARSLAYVLAVMAILGAGAAFGAQAVKAKRAGAMRPAYQQG